MLKATYQNKIRQLKLDQMFEYDFSDQEIKENLKRINYETKKKIIQEKKKFKKISKETK